jgi:acyl carrier protein phosphodiesterase
MNFLAHLYLSGDHEELSVGNFIADHVKGKAIEKFSAGIQHGIRFHRGIDHFTDTHQLIRESVEHLRPGYGKYSGVVMDMFCDHFLAAGWHLWSDIPLKEFTHSKYAVLLKYEDILPARTQHMLKYMMRDDWLSSYADPRGLNMALNGMSRRTTFVSNLQHAAAELNGDREFYLSRFNRFFPELIDYTQNILIELA